MSVESNTIVTWDQFAEEFQKRYKDNTNWEKSQRDLDSYTQKEDETFADFAERWRKKVVQTLDGPNPTEQIRIFLKNLQLIFYERMRYLPYSNFPAILDVSFHIDEKIRIGLIKVDAPSSSFRYSKGNQSKAAAPAPVVNVIGNIPITTSPVVLTNRDYRNVPLTYDGSINMVEGGNNTNRNGRGIYKKNDRHFDELHAPASLIFRGLMAQGVLKPMDNYKPPNPLPATWDHS